MKEVDVSSLEHTSWRCQYHVVFASKYRRMEIYGKIKEDIGIILRKLCQQVDTVGRNKKAIKAYTHGVPYSPAEIEYRVPPENAR